MPVDTSVDWFKFLKNNASEICFITGGRISFIRADTKKKVNGNNKGSLYAVFNPRSFGECKTSHIDRDEIFSTYEKIKDSIPDKATNTVWPKEVNSIFSLIENAKVLPSDLQLKVKQSINKMIIDRLPHDQMVVAAQNLVNRMEAKA